jgi:hypothetical protein
MTITIRARVALLLAVVALLVAGIAGARSVTAGSQESGVGDAGDGRDGVVGICATPGSPPVIDGEAEARSSGDCDDTIDVPRSEPGECDEQVFGTDPDATVSYTPCPGDAPAAGTDPYDGAQEVEPTPGMSDVSARIFDDVIVGDDDRTLTIFFWSGVEPCYVLDHVDVAYRADAITITLFEGHDASAGDVACIEIALLKKVVVPLDEQAGDRAIVDGAA